MYHHLLVAHSYLRWLVLAALLFQLGWFYVQMKKKAILTTRDYQLLLFLTVVTNCQFILGWWLYTESPLVHAFWADTAQNIKSRPLRFFGIEHMTMMTLGVVMMNGVVIRIKKKIGTPCFGLLWTRYLIVIIIMISSIPWSFSPFTARPNWR